MPDSTSSGPLTREELTTLWTSAVDDLYAQPLIEQGEGSGLEIHTQAHEQFARVSRAIDLTTQAMYINAWSGQTNDAAQGENKAIVLLTFERDLTLLNSELRLSAGFTVEEQVNDAGENGAEAVLTGRRYILLTDIGWSADYAVPKTGYAIAENVGYGYNNPSPGSINTPYQLGKNFFNDRASVTVVGTVEKLIVENEPDVVIPEHVNQYVQFVGGANAGAIRRIIGFLPAEPTAIAPNGGTLILEQSAPLTPEAFTAKWRILDWVANWGLTVTNAASPTGGRLAMLDALGEERNIRRSVGESDGAYATRVSTIADVVTPNAIRRAANRVLAPYGLKCTLREVGSVDLPGLYYDVELLSPQDPTYAFAYDLDYTIRPEDRFKYYLDELEMRAFFLIEVPKNSIGEFGMAYDEGIGYYDSTDPFDVFLDGYAPGTAILLKQVWDAVYKVKAGGVGFDVFMEH